MGAQWVGGSVRFVDTAPTSGGSSPYYDTSGRLVTGMAYGYFGDEGGQEVFCLLVTQAVYFSFTRVMAFEKKLERLH